MNTTKEQREQFSSLAKLYCMDALKWGIAATLAKSVITLLDDVEQAEAEVVALKEVICMLAGNSDAVSSRVRFLEGVSQEYSTALDASEEENTRLRRLLDLAAYALVKAEESPFTVITGVIREALTQIEKESANA